MTVTWKDRFCLVLAKCLLPTTVILLRFLGNGCKRNLNNVLEDTPIYNMFLYMSITKQKEKELYTSYKFFACFLLLFDVKWKHHILCQVKGKTRLEFGVVLSRCTLALIRIILSRYTILYSFQLQLTEDSFASPTEISCFVILLSHCRLYVSIKCS